MRGLLHANRMTNKALYISNLGLFLIDKLLRQKYSIFYILSQTDESIIRQVFNEQWKTSSKNDWTEQIKTYTKDLNINKNLEEGKGMTKSMLKELVRRTSTHTVSV